MEEKWIVYAKKADFDEISKKYNITPYTARIIRNRDVISDEDINMYLNGTIDSINSPFLFKDMDIAVELLISAVMEKKSIRIIGDYDIDGICSTYILSKAIKTIGGNVSIDIPDRIKDGYGINKNIIDRAYKDKVDVIITCDNGIAAYDEIQYAKTLGMTVIVTDHHEVPYEEIEGVKKYKIVPADAVVDHKRADCKYPFKEMCGAALAYRYMMAVKERFETSDNEYHKKMAIEISRIEDEIIIFAAIATVGDVVSLVGENRIIVKQGLNNIALSTNIGLNALIDECKLKKNAITSFHIGFVLGPCLNATGRLDTAKIAYSLLCEEDGETAKKMAVELVELNNIRKNITAEGEEKAYKLAEEYENDKVLVLYLEGIHESIAGIIAGRVREKFNKPAIVLTDGEESVKGSGRSIESYNMFKEINKHRDLLIHFGGHPMAAGLSIAKDNIEIFRRKLNEDNSLTADDMIRKKWIDIPLPLNYITEEFVEELDSLHPFGKDNEKPLFATKNVELLKGTLIGQNKDILKLTLCQNGIKMIGMLFRGSEDFLEQIKKEYGQQVCDNLLKGKDVNIKLSILYYPAINEYNGMRTLQIQLSGWIVKE